MYDFAVLFLSETGNAGMLAKELYSYLPSDNKVIVDLQQDENIPKASFYFIGFDIRNETCNLKILNLLGEIEEGMIALFATCGQPLTDRSRDQLEGKFNLWIENEDQYAGMFICQGRLPKDSYSRYRQKAQQTLSEEQLEQFLSQLEEGQSHPNDTDMAELKSFVENVLQMPF